MKLTDLNKDLPFGDLIKDSTVRWLARANTMAIFRAMPFEIEKLDKPTFSFVERVRQIVANAAKLSVDTPITTNHLFGWMFAVGNTQKVLISDDCIELITLRIEEVAAYLACHNIRVMWFPRITGSQIYDMASAHVDNLENLSEIYNVECAWEANKIDDPGLIELGAAQTEYPFELLQYLTAIGNVEGIVKEVLRLTSYSIEYVSEDDLTKALLSAWNIKRKKDEKG